MPFMTNGKRDYTLKWNAHGRFCSVCSEFKSWEEYSWKYSYKYKNKKPNIHQIKQPKCKSCAHLETKRWRENQSPERIRDLYLQRTYQINYLDYCKLLQEQEHRCKICYRELDTNLGNPTSNANTAVVDHCHINGKIRGILCNECNRGLGYFHDNKESLMNAIIYLSRNDLILEGGQCSCPS